MAKQKPDRKVDTWYSIIGILAIVGRIIIDAYYNLSVYDLYYGRVGYLFMGLLCALMAYRKNRNVISWFALGLYFFIIPFVVIIFMPKLHNRLCPYCREGIALDATACPHCAKDLMPIQSQLENGIEPIV